ncbi:MAG: ParB/RepB/Spo0J family partition protein [Stackebrandtia sp.]
MRKKGGLGKGLAALIPSEPPPSAEAPAAPVPVSRETTGVPETPAPREAEDDSDVSRETSDDPDLVPVPGARYQLIPIDEIVMNPKQPRQVFDEESSEELKASLSEVGLLQPIAVRRRVGEPGFELIMGERRTRAARDLGWETIPAIVREIKDEELLRDALLENIHRVQLNPLEEGAAYQQLLDEFDVTQEELSRRIGRSRPQISNMIRLLSLPGSVQRRVAAGVLSAGHARALLSLDSAQRQDALATRIVAEGLSVRAVEEIVALQGAEPEPAADDVSRETSASRNGKLHAPGLTDLADRLSDHFDTRVKVSLGKKKGRVVIEFGSVADLERIAKSMGVENAADD